MGKKLSPDEIYTPDYCTSALSDGERPSEKFCSACGEVVYDVSKMTRREFEKLRAHRISFCGVTTWVDGELQFAPDPQPVRARLSQVALAAMLSIPAAGCDDAERPAAVATEPVESGPAPPGAAARPSADVIDVDEDRAVLRAESEPELDLEWEPPIEFGAATMSTTDHSGSVHELRDTLEHGDERGAREEITHVHIINEKRKIRQRPKREPEDYKIIGLIRGDH